MHPLPDIPSITLPGGCPLPRLGLGTWRMGEAPKSRKQEVAAIAHAFCAGIKLIDTAEMYGDGGAEEVVGEAMRAAAVPRESLFIVSKVYPWNASRQGTREACERSLRRLRTDMIDLYLLHWRGEHPLADTLRAFEELKGEGKIRHWGVSNFDTADMRQLELIDVARQCAVNQVYYNLAKRWPEATLMPWQKERGIATMAYSPLNQGTLQEHPLLQAIAQRKNITAAQIALAWLMRTKDVIVIPKTSRLAGVNEILGTRLVTLDADDLAQLENAFPPPKANARMQTT